MMLYKVYLKWSYAFLDLRVHEKVLSLFQESFNVTTVFLQLRHFLLEVRVGPIRDEPLFFIEGGYLFRKKIVRKL